MRKASDEEVGEGEARAPDSGFLKREPLWTVAGVTGAATALIAALTEFGVEVSDSQQVAVLGVVTVAAPLVVALVGRSKVWSPAGLDQAVEEATIEILAPLDETTEFEAEGTLASTDEDDFEYDPELGSPSKYVPSAWSAAGQDEEF